MSDYFWWDTYTDLKRDLGREPLDDEVEDEYNRRYGWEVPMNAQDKKEIVKEVKKEVRSEIIGWVVAGTVFITFSALGQELAKTHPYISMFLFMPLGLYGLYTIGSWIVKMGKKASKAFD